VVKANGYGHGAVTSALAALRGGAVMLGVALVEEAAELRAAGIEAPVLLLSEFPDGAAAEVVALGLVATVYSEERIAALALAARSAGVVADVHLKVDTGMHRVGAAPSDAVRLASLVVDSPSLRLAGTFTHLAVADVPADPYTAQQTSRFSDVVASLRSAGIDPGVLHASNSAGGIAHPASRFDLVRFGVAIYGNAPDASLDMRAYDIDLEPVLTLRSEVSHVKVVGGGERVSYGLQWTTPTDRVVATVPIGYADGVPRRLSSVGGEVLIGGRRCPIAGRVTMDQIVVDCGPVGVSDVHRGDEVVFLGAQGDDRITPWEWATRLDTIAYEITCGISSRVPRMVC
jgi:alanine racemase